MTKILGNYECIRVCRDDAFDVLHAQVHRNRAMFALGA